MSIGVAQQRPRVGRSHTLRPPIGTRVVSRARCSACVQAELVAVRVGNSTPSARSRKSVAPSRSSRWTSLPGSGSARSRRCRFRPRLVRPAGRPRRPWCRRAATGQRSPGSRPRRAASPAHRPEQADIASSVACDLAEVARAGQEGVARFDHAHLVASRVSQHDEGVVGSLAHIDVAATEVQRRVDGPLLVLEAGAGQVEVQPSRADLFGAEVTNRIPTCVASPGTRAPPGSATTSRPSSPAQNAATAGASATSKVTASRSRTPSP